MKSSNLNSTMIDEDNQRQDLIINCELRKKSGRNNTFDIIFAFKTLLRELCERTVAPYA